MLDFIVQSMLDWILQSTETIIAQWSSTGSSMKLHLNFHTTTISRVFILSLGQIKSLQTKFSSNRAVKSTQYKKLVPNALRFTYWNLKSCKPHEKQNKKHQNARYIGEILRVWCSLFHIFHVICKISNFNMWTEEHLAQASCTELTLLKLRRISIDKVVCFDLNCVLIVGTFCAFLFSFCIL